MLFFKIHLSEGPVLVSVVDSHLWGRGKFLHYFHSNRSSEFKQLSNALSVVIVDVWQT